MGGPTDRIAPWGELLTAAAIARGAAGCVTDGLVRDVRHIRRMKFPVFHGGIGPLDSRGRGRMIEMDRPVICAGVRVCVGDTVFGDVDGVVVVPQGISEQVFAKALGKVKHENRTRDELREGRLLSEVYASTGFFSSRSGPRMTPTRSQSSKRNRNDVQSVKLKASCRPPSADVRDSRAHSERRLGARAPR